MSEPQTTDGGVALAAWFEAHPETSRATFAEWIGRPKSSLSKWIRHLTRPDAEARIAIQHRAGIPIEAWLTEEERRAMLVRAIQHPAKTEKEEP
jgi:hypothetical protein